jgi:predicted transcriptional regulator
MIRKQFFIDEQQNKRLKRLALAIGKSEGELIREGVDHRLSRKDAEEADWKAGLRQARGMWADYPEIEQIMKERREARARRRDRMNRLMRGTKS